VWRSLIAPQRAFDGVFATETAADRRNSRVINLRTAAASAERGCSTPNSAIRAARSTTSACSMRRTSSSARNVP
jgi:hypothetical protein